MKTFFNILITIIIIIAIPTMLYYAVYIPVLLGICALPPKQWLFFLLGFLTIIVILIIGGIVSFMIYGIYDMVSEAAVGETIINKIDDIKYDISVRKARKEKIKKQDGQISI